VNPQEHQIMSHEHTPREEHACTCCRRALLAGAGVGTLGLLARSGLYAAEAGAAPAAKPRKKTPARVRTAFLYPPSKTFAENPDGWWSWPGNDFDPEKRQKQYTAALNKMARKLCVTIQADEGPTGSAAAVAKLAKEITADPPDAVLLVMFYNRFLHHADALLKAAAAKNVPVIFFIGLGVKHGAIDRYSRPGVYFIQSLDNMAALQRGLRLVHARTVMRQAKLLSITEAPKPREGVEKFLGTTVRVIPFAQYAAEFKKARVGAAEKKLLAALLAGATERRGLTDASLDSAMKAHVALKTLLAREQADGLTMNCLRRGFLKPCISFALLNGQLIPAACENDLPAMYTQMLGQLLTGRAGFQHNPAFDTEKNHYYASHCTCATKLRGPDGKDVPYLLRRFAHTNEGSTAIQTFWPDGEAVSMMRYYPGKAPALDVYAGKVVKSHPMPPAAGCTTNVEIAITDRRDAREVKGHHNVLFLGDHTRTFRLFAQLYRMRLADTGYTGRFPV